MSKYVSVRHILMGCLLALFSLVVITTVIGQELPSFRILEESITFTHSKVEEPAAEATDEYTANVTMVTSEHFDGLDNFCLIITSEPDIVCEGDESDDAQITLTSSDYSGLGASETAIITLTVWIPKQDEGDSFHSQTLNGYLELQSGAEIVTVPMEIPPQAEDTTAPSLSFVESELIAKYDVNSYTGSITVVIENKGQEVSSVEFCFILSSEDYGNVFEDCFDDHNSIAVKVTNSPIADRTLAKNQFEAYSIEFDTPLGSARTYTGWLVARALPASPIKISIKLLPVFPQILWTFPELLHYSHATVASTIIVLAIFAAVFCYVITSSSISEHGNMKISIVKWKAGESWITNLAGILGLFTAFSGANMVAENIALIDASMIQLLGLFFAVVLVLAPFLFNAFTTVRAFVFSNALLALAVFGELAVILVLSSNLNTILGENNVEFGRIVVLFVQILVLVGIGGVILIYIPKQAKSSVEKQSAHIKKQSEHNIERKYVVAITEHVALIFKRASEDFAINGDITIIKDKYIKRLYAIIKETKLLSRKMKLDFGRYITETEQFLDRIAPQYSAT
ncbi:MAG: hypothetical protein KC615_19030, partial [Anaerolineae bacterium]|nr:hypothetical protein [Anaerolineae bacterium]